jgi:hypothetical protein
MEDDDRLLGRILTRPPRGEGCAASFDVALAARA